jgi:hypothetical protein
MADGCTSRKDIALVIKFGRDTVQLPMRIVVADALDLLPD